MNGRGLGFLKTSTILPDGGFRPVARFVCNGCGATSEFSLKSREGVNPEAMAKLVRGRGWVADPFRRSASYCPACLVRPKNDPNSELKRVNLMPKTPEPSSATREATPQQPRSNAQQFAITSINTLTTQQGRTSMACPIRRLRMQSIFRA